MDHLRVVYLIRHGKLENPDNIIYGRTIHLSLSIEGIDQVTRLSEKIHLIDSLPMRIITSPLHRTRKTSHILSNAFGGSEIINDERLIETDCGKLEGTSFSFFEQGVDAYQQPMRGLYHVEDPHEIIERMCSALNDQLAMNFHEPFCMVSHGDPLAFLMWKLVHPRELSIPGDADIKKCYLNTGECWRMLFNANTSLQSFKHITFR